MRQFVFCSGCNHQVPTPDSLEGKPNPQFLKCETCGNEFFWNGGLTDNSEPLILFSIEDPVESLESTEVAEFRSEEGQSDELGLDDAPPIGDLEIEEFEIEEFEISELEQPEETPFEPLRLVAAENKGVTNEETETAESLTQAFEPLQLDLARPQEIVPLLELDPPTQSASEPVVSEPVFSEAMSESFDLELEIESEPDTQSTDTETPNSTTNEVAAGHEEDPSAVGETHFETEPNAETHASEYASIDEPAVPAALDSSPDVDWGVLGSTVPRRRPKEASAFRKILPPILGGLAAFPIATLILWYGFGKDIGVGPTVAKYVPWIVPEKFRSMPFDSSPPSFASGRTSSPSTRNTLPTLNREESTVPPNDTIAQTFAAEKPNVEPEKPKSQAEPKANSESESSTSNIPQTIVAIKALQKEMENSPPKDKKGKAGIFIACQSKLKELSKQASEVTGPSAHIWNKQIETISRIVLADSDIPRVMGILGNKSSGDIKASVSGDFVATVLEIAEADSPLKNATWQVREKWRSDDGGIPIEVLPGAWPTSSSPLPATCMAFGRLLPKEDSDASAPDSRSKGPGLVLKVHLLVPK